MAKMTPDQIENYLRQMDIADPEKFTLPVTILGAGAVGSAVAMAVSKMGVRKINLIDFDKFERHNVSNQFCFEKSHIGMSKVEAVAEMVDLMSATTTVVKHEAKLVGDNLVYLDGRVIPFRNVAEGILINCPDDMGARKDALTAVKLNYKCPWVIDSRMAAQYMDIHICNTTKMDQVKQYEGTMYSNEEATEEPCGARAIIYTTMFSGGIIATLVKKILMGQAVPSKISMDVHNFCIVQTVNGTECSSITELAMATVG
jgi:hypothetical protein